MSTTVATARQQRPAAAMQIVNGERHSNVPALTLENSRPKKPTILAPRWACLQNLFEIKCIIGK